MIRAVSDSTHRKPPHSSKRSSKPRDDDDACRSSGACCLLFILEGRMTHFPETRHCSMLCGGQATAKLPNNPYPQLHLPWLADAALYGAVEVEDQVCYFGAVEILAVEEIEDVEGRLDFVGAEGEVFGEAEVEGGVEVVLAAEVALGYGAVGIDAVL